MKLKATTAGRFLFGAKAPRAFAVQFLQIVGNWRRLSVNLSALLSAQQRGPQRHLRLTRDNLGHADHEFRSSYYANLQTTKVSALLFFLAGFQANS